MRRTDARRLTVTQVENARTIQATDDAIWRVVADPARLAEWVPTARVARPADAEDVHLEGKSHGHPYSVTSPFHADEAHRRLEWSAPAVPGYEGSLEVLGQGDASEVQLHLIIPDDRLPASDDVIAEVRRGMDEALERLASLVAS
jgi:uncharacterized protein YndB with AHSA1/START domain